MVVGWPGIGEMAELFILATLLQEALEHSITEKEERLKSLTSQLTKLEAVRTDEQVTSLPCPLYHCSRPRIELMAFPTYSCWPSSHAVHKRSHHFLAGQA